MTFGRPTAKRIIGGALLFVLGALAGGLGVWGLGRHASGAYLSVARLTFRNAQNEQAATAWHAGDFDAALGHAFCELEAEHGLGAKRAFDRRAMPWDLFSLVFLQSMIIDPNAATAEKARPISEAGDRAKLAVILERLGRKEAADREFAIAARLTGRQDVSKWRWLGLEAVDMWSKVRDPQRAGAPPASGDSGAGPAAETAKP